MKNLINNKKVLKAIGVGATLVGVGIAFLQTRIDEHERDELIRQEVDARFKELQESQD